jgi:carboxymethylenebutenolidase
LGNGPAAKLKIVVLRKEHVTVQRQDIEVESAEGHFSGYMAVPARTNGVSIVVLQEIFGVNANIRAIADGFADSGYAVIAPDLYWRQQPGVQLDPEIDRELAMSLMKGLCHDQAITDGAAALAALRQRVGGLQHSAAVGYCFGGGVAFLMGARGLVEVGVAYYGTGLHTMLSELNDPKGDLLLHIAAEDYLCSPKAQETIAAAAAKVSDRVTVLSHSGVGHAFARMGGATFDKEAADRANDATMKLLKTLTNTT